MNSFQRLGDGRGLCWLKRLLMIGIFTPRWHVVHEKAAWTMGKAGKQGKFVYFNWKFSSSVRRYLSVVLGHL